jgi:predicted secreted protein
MKLIPILLLLLPSFSAWAGNFDRLNFLGFSKDGNFLAYETYGVADGSGFPYAEIRIVDVNKNAVTKDVFREHKKEVADSEAGIERSLEGVRARVFRQAKKRLAGLAIAPKPLAPLVHHPLTDLGVDPHKISFTLDDTFGSASEKLDLVLKEILAQAPDCPASTTAKPPAYFELTLIDSAAKSIKELQKDSTLPKSRGCAYEYRIQDVYFYRPNSAIAIFLTVLRPGFEGPDQIYLVVTGKIK